MSQIFNTLINRNIITPQDMQGTLPEYDNIAPHSGMMPYNMNMQRYIPCSPQEVAINTMQIDQFQSQQPKKINWATVGVIGTLGFIGYKVLKSCFWVLSKLAKFKK